VSEAQKLHIQEIVEIGRIGGKDPYKWTEDTHLQEIEDKGLQEVPQIQSVFMIVKEYSFLWVLAQEHRQFSVFCHFFEFLGLF